MVVLAILLAGGAAAYGRLHKQVTLVVDGRTWTVTSYRSTVGDLLESQGIPVGRHDVVTPSAEAPLGDGMRVDLLRAKEITLLLNGVERTLIVAGRTVADVLEHANLRMDRHSLIRPSRAATIEDGDVIVYREAVSVSVRFDGRARDVVTNALTVGSLLRTLGIELGDRDRVEPGPGADLEEGLRVRVTRFDLRRVAEESVIPFGTEVRETDSLPAGEQRILSEGRSGLVEVVYRVRLRDGAVVDKEEVSRLVIQEPEDRVVLEGTAAPPPPSPSTGTGGTSSRRASGSSSSGDSGRSHTGQATWYERDGMVAAHQTLPLGTEVTVTNLNNGRTVTVVINDRGPYAEGRIIDLGDDAFARLAPLSSGAIPVRISW
jgi:resuscitation-promoting factor RpfB